MELDCWVTTSAADTEYPEHEAIEPLTQSSCGIASRPHLLLGMQFINYAFHTAHMRCSIEPLCIMKATQTREKGSGEGSDLMNIADLDKCQRVNATPVIQQGFDRHEQAIP